MEFCSSEILGFSSLFALFAQNFFLRTRGGVQLDIALNIAALNKYKYIKKCAILVRFYHCLRYLTLFTLSLLSLPLTCPPPSTHTCAHRHARALIVSFLIPSNDDDDGDDGDDNDPIWFSFHRPTINYLPCPFLAWSMASFTSSSSLSTPSIPSRT